MSSFKKIILTKQKTKYKPESKTGSTSGLFLIWSDSPVNEDSSTFELFIKNIILISSCL